MIDVFGWWTKKCYGELGCFEPRTIMLNPYTPEAPEDLKTLFLLNSRQNPDPNSSTIVEYLNIRSPLTPIFSGGGRETLKPSSPVKVIVHGFGGSPHRDYVPELTEALLKWGDVNVVRVDWSLACQFPYYNQASVNAQIVGAMVAVFVKRLVQEFGMRPDQFHIIGISLAAHVAGYAGATFSATNINQEIARITGLDPAKPLFENEAATVRLDPSDAAFVDVIHTDGGSLWKIFTGKLGVGMLQPCGHIDFYPNGGGDQPGCAGKDLFCNHRRSVEFFLESVKERGCRFEARRCEDWNTFKDGKCNDNEEEVMGIDATAPENQSLTMKLYLKTGSGKPFCLGKEGVNVTTSK